MAEVILYFKNGEEIACCPPDPEPEDGSFDTWYAGRGYSIAEARQDAEAACDWTAELLAEGERAMADVTVFAKTRSRGHETIILRPLSHIVQEAPEVDRHTAENDNFIRLFCGPAALMMEEARWYRVFRGGEDWGVDFLRYKGNVYAYQHGDATHHHSWGQLTVAEATQPGVP